MKRRVLKIFERLSPTPDALLIANAVEPNLDQTFFYLFDAPSGLFEKSVEVAFPDGRLHVLVSPLEEESARQATNKDSSVEVHVVASKDATGSTLHEILPGSPTVALNNPGLTLEWFRRLETLFPDSKWTDAADAIQRVRATKESDELDRIRRAAQIASKVGEDIPGLLTTGVTEQQVAAEVENRMRREGGDGRSFETIVGFGPHSAEPHYHPDATRLDPGMSIVVDFGTFYHKYASDVTRSFRFGPRDDELKRVHEKVEQAQAAALREIRAGVPANIVHLAAKAVIDDSPWKGRFNHGLGHSIGLAVHDGFSMDVMIDRPLEAGMALTVEPGIYLPGKGGVRIEDDIVVTDSGYEFLSTTRRQYLEVGA